MEAVEWVFAEQLHILPWDIGRLRYRLFCSFEERAWEQHFEAQKVQVVTDGR